MWLLNKKVYYLLIFLLPVLSFGQNCDVTIKGYVLDESTGVTLPFTTVYIEELEKGIAANESGCFLFKGICPGSYHIHFSHVGCEGKEQLVSVLNDTILHIVLNHHSELMNEVVVHGKKGGNTARISNTVVKDKIIEEGNKNLAEVIKSIQGVSVLRTGSGISKPVIHGLYGNRITILNNGIVQAGQQWGNDHSPEIDPFVADHISVIKGASALVYSGGSLGGIVMVEPDEISEDTILNGNVNYLYQTNGMGHTLNTSMEKNSPGVKWRITGTAKLLGDMKSADYYLTNTGRREGDLAIQLEKRFSNKWYTNLYYSMFNTNIGILKGAHVENKTDLEERKNRTVPLYTEKTASYYITAPRQGVQHHILKFEAKYLISQKQWLNIKYGGQVNNRKEFDVRRGERSDTAALSILQNNQLLEGIYSKMFSKGRLLKTGVQFNYTDNTNDNGETRILPLIPDYRSYEGGVFTIFKKEQHKLFYEFGARYDVKYAKVIDVSTLEIERFNHLFQDYSLSSGVAYKVTSFLKTNLDIGYVYRSPEINELYSFGLHQGVSGIEEGNRKLDSERSLKFVLTTDWNIRQRLFFQAVTYYQDIQDYIYLQPQEESRYTIQGVFQVFTYEQTNAQIIGSDLLLSYEPVKRLKVVTKFAALRGTNTNENIPLIYMPSNNCSGTITYSLNDLGKIKTNSISVHGEYVFKQRYYIEGQDYLPPPDGYFLLGLNALTNISFRSRKSIKVSIQFENMLNEKYRDYMNRQRYFADDLGINVIMRLSYSF